MVGWGFIDPNPESTFGQFMKCGLYHTANWVHGQKLLNFSCPFRGKSRERGRECQNFVLPSMGMCTICEFYSYFRFFFEKLRWKNLEIILSYIFLLNKIILSYWVLDYYFVNCDFKFLKLFQIETSVHFHYSFMLCWTIMGQRNARNQWWNFAFHLGYAILSCKKRM